ncbi:glycosyltransferase [Chitinophaga sp.]|uniref:glycosyltransferase n=1 Tax=Chitinophaga sp. TaxID=1869181 RepID=UPI002F927B0C
MPTLSLCMIVRNEEEVIDRCLHAVHPLVDEIIIIDTGSTDNTVATCYKYTHHVLPYIWQQDFAAARNYAFAQATCDYILWLDADDLIAPDQLQLLLALKERLAADVYFLQYDYAQDEYGQSACTLFRERIVRNDGTFRWKYPVHEVIDGTMGRTNSYEQIVIRHARTAHGAAADQGRNLAILQQAVLLDEYQSDPRIWYYLGRELHDHQRYLEAITAFAHFLSLPDGWQEERMMATFRTAQCYTALSTADNVYAYTAREYARKAMSLDERWAEPYFVMGELAYQENHYDEAIYWFRQCLRELPPVLSPVSREIYLLRPCVYLVLCHDRLRQYEAAWEYNEKALTVKPQDAGLLYNREYLAQQLTKENSIAWYGASLSPVFPAYRIRALQMHTALQQLGVDSSMTNDSLALLRCRHVIFFKSFSEDEYKVMLQMKQLGKRIFLDVTEDLLIHTADFPYYLPMIQLADTVICCSHALAERLAAWNQAVVVIEDAVETVTHSHQIAPSGMLTAGWFGMPENAHHAEQLRPLLEQQECRLVTIHNGPGHDKYWTPDTWQYHLAQCDVVMAPLDVTTQPCKSNNKVTTAMAMGLPVIAAPLDAYERIIRHGVNGFIADTTADWQAAISELQDPLRRSQLRELGLHTAMAFRPVNIALKWWKTISPETYRQSAVDIIIPTIYNTPHLYHCINSILACTHTPFHIMVVHSGTHPLSLPGEVTVIRADALNYAAAINLGIAHSTASYICMMNDDVIVSDGWLQPLLEDIHQGAGFSNPLSNCDEGFLHHYPLELKSVRLGAGTNMLHNEQIVHRAQPEVGIAPSAIWSYQPGVQPRRYYHDWVPFFCTLTSRSLIEKVGLLDDGFNNGCEDVDYCRRASALGYTSVVNENSFVFHFGGTSRIHHVTEQPKEKDTTHQLFKYKHRAPLLCIHAGLAYENWNAYTIQEQGIGGSETAVAALAAAFVSEGYRVVVCCACEGKSGMIDGVEYIPLDAFQHFADRNFIEIFIMSRYLSTLQYRVRARKKYFWLHDIIAMPGGGEGIALQDHLPSLDGICCLSPWHREFVANYYQISPEKIFIIGNGIDVSRFGQKKEKTPDRFIYSSSPDRSLDKLLQLFPAIRQVLPNATLHIYYGFDNWEKSLVQIGNAAQLALRDEIRAGMQQEGVFYHGRVDQQTLAAAFLESDIWLYPTSFTETFCITALEAQAARTLCICTPVAGLLSTVADRGVFLELGPDDVGFEEHVISVLTTIREDGARKTMLLDRAEAWALQQSWSSIARQWIPLFNHSAEIHYAGREIQAVEC